MNALLAGLSFFSAVFLSGAIFYKIFVSHRIHSTPTILLASSFVFSLIFNFVFVYLVVFLSLYTQKILLLKLILEICIFVFLYRHDFFNQIQFNNIRGGSAIIFSIGLFCSLIVLNLILNSIFKYSIFYTWDAVVSWNRWATEWANGKFILNDGGYPQIYPILLSMGYVLSSKISSYQSIGISIYFYFMFVAITFAAFILFNKDSIKESSLGLCIALLTYFIFNILIDEFYIGYVDMPVSMMILISAICLLKIESIDNRFYIFLGALSAGVASEIKQAGLFWCVFYILGLFHYRYYYPSKVSRKDILYSLLIIIFLIAPWLIIGLYKKFILHTNITNVSVVMGDIHEGRGYFERLSLAIKNYKNIFVLFLFSIPSLFSNRFRFFALSALIYYFFWAFTLSYDIRNLQGGLPPLIISLSALIIYFPRKPLESVFLFFYRRLPIASLSLCLVVLTVLFINSEKIPSKEYKQKILLGGKEASRLVADAFDNYGAKMLVTDNQPIAYSPLFEKYYYPYGFNSVSEREFEEFAKEFKNKNGSFYVLLPTKNYATYMNLPHKKLGESDYYTLMEY